MFSQRTTTTLLEGLHDPANSTAWRELDGRCRPIMFAVAIRMGLRKDEAEDAVQAAMMSFLEAYRGGLYDRARGRLSAFIVTILRRRAIDVQRARHKGAEGALQTSVEQLSNADITRFWLDERKNQILRQAIDELRSSGVDDRMLDAFELFGLRRADIAEVTSRLGMSREEVYNAKYRITQRLQPIVAKIEALYEDL